MSFKVRRFNKTSIKKTERVPVENNFLDVGTKSEESQKEYEIPIVKDNLYIPKPIIENKLYMDPFAKVEKLHVILKQKQQIYYKNKKEYDDLYIVYSEYKDKLDQKDRETQKNMEDIKMIKNQISYENEEIEKKHKEVIMKLRENNRILCENLNKIKNERKIQINKHRQNTSENFNKIKSERDTNISERSSDVDEYNIYVQNLMNHMKPYKNDLYYELMIFALSFKPSKYKKRTIQYIKNIPTLEKFSAHRKHINTWIRKNNTILQTSMYSTDSMIDYMIKLIQYISELRGEDKINKQLLFTRYKLAS
jgi:hypothetical protein